MDEGDQPEDNFQNVSFDEERFMEIMSAIDDTEDFLSRELPI